MENHELRGVEMDEYKGEVTIRTLQALLLGFILLVPATRTSATPILFDFNTLAAGLNSTTGEAPGDPIEAYMEGLYGSNITVNVGAQTQKNRIESGHPAGLYLGNSDGALDRGPFVSPPGHPDPKDTFLINRWNATSLPADVRDRIVITFDRPIASVEFDWEIFPQTSGVADITIKADGTTIFYELLPATPIDERRLGDLGHFAHFDFVTPVHTLEFIDWNTAPIGIDNLTVNDTIPEPATLLLLGSGLAVMAVWRRPGKA